MPKLPKEVARGKWVESTSATFEMTSGPGAHLKLVGPKQGVVADDVEMTIDNENFLVFKLFTPDDKTYYVLADTPVTIIPLTKLSPTEVVFARSMQKMMRG